MRKDCDEQGFWWLYCISNMDDFINLRYSRRVHLDTFTVSRTSNFNRLPRKQSADPTRSDALRPSKVLPRLQPAKEQQYLSRRVHVSTDMKRRTDPDVSILQLSLKRQKLNLTKFSISLDKDEAPQRFAVCSRQGKRSYNEDRYICKVRNCSIFEQKHIFMNKREPYDLFAVFDGHGGANCAEFLKEHFAIILSRSKHVDTHPQLALRQTFEKCEQKFIELCESKSGAETSGSCAVVCLVVGSRIVVANLGDSRALMLGKGVLQLTTDHKPHEVAEKMRIIKHGGKIYREQEGTINQIKLFRQMRVLPGNLNVTRTIGDVQVKLRKYGGLPGMISPVPDIATHDKKEYEVLLLGSDGLFEAFDSQEIRQLYEEVAKQHQGVSHQKWLKIFVQTLCEQAQGKSNDNITVIAVLLK